MTDLRSAALNADDITTETVPVPEWGGAVYGVKALTIAEQRAFIESVSSKDSGGDRKIDRDRYAIQLLIATVVDPETGEPVFEQADAEALNAKSGQAIGRLLTVASRLAGLSGEEQVDEAVESLSETPGSDGD